jgi:hypothetical protein
LVKVKTVKIFFSEASEEILIVERRYNTLRRPLYESRAKLIKKIDNFWFLTIMNHSGIQPIVATFEVPCMKVQNLYNLILNSQCETTFYSLVLGKLHGGGPRGPESRL